MENEIMKVKYLPAEMEIVAFETEDIITSSGCGSHDEGNDDL